MSARLSAAPCRRQRWAFQLCLASRLLPPLCSDPSQQFPALGLSSLGHLSHTSVSQAKVLISILRALADSCCSQNRRQNLEPTQLLPWVPPMTTWSLLLFPVSVVISKAVGFLLKEWPAFPPLVVTSPDFIWHTWVSCQTWCVGYGCCIWIFSPGRHSPCCKHKCSQSSLQQRWPVCSGMG